MDVFKHSAVLEIQSAVFIFQKVISDNAYFASVGNGYLDFIFGSIDSYDVEGNEFFAVVEFEFREIVSGVYNELYCLTQQIELFYAPFLFTMEIVNEKVVGYAGKRFGKRCRRGDPSDILRMRGVQRGSEEKNLSYAQSNFD